jgi:hypothetical protein
MTLNLDDLNVTTFATDAAPAGEEFASYVTRFCPPSYNSMCEYTCVTCNGCESGPAGAC